jgi:hypothetical protein
MKRQLRRDWWLGFGGFMAFYGIRYFTTHDWMDLLWFLWIVWFVYFVPVRRR